jgi:hypothetical protein
MDKNKVTEPKITIADLFIPAYEDMIEHGENGETFVAKGLRIPPGFVLFVLVMLAWGVKALF